jgi:hypothetical protein
MPAIVASSSTHSGPVAFFLVHVCGLGLVIRFQQELVPRLVVTLHNPRGQTVCGAGYKYVMGQADRHWADT